MTGQRQAEPGAAFAADRPAPGRLLRELPVLFAIAAVIAYLVKTFLAQPFYIPSGSMLPQLEINDRVVVSKLSYRLHDPNRGDIVVFDAPGQVAGARSDGGGNLVVRVVRGLGEAVGVVQPSTEEFIKRVIALPGETVEARAGRVHVNGLLLVEPYLPPGTETADFGPAVVPEGGLWVMGDNRGNSMDSRSFGAVERGTVVGRAILRVWPLGRSAFL
ncbi:MAG: signal peptidase I [Acidimicrobiales bacterium]